MTLEVKAQIKSLARKILPQAVHQDLRKLILGAPRILERRETERIFTTSPVVPDFLGEAELEKLQARYPFPPKYGWDVDTLETRGNARAVELLKLPGSRTARDFLELGCWDGMVSGHLSARGKTATAVDFRDIGFDQRAVQRGARLMQMDAAHLSFDDDSFDCIFSYDAFEHFSAPDVVLGEVARTLRKGGYAYLDFGPLYYSPFGEHAYDSITVPYCQFLFPPDVINAFATRNGLKLVDFSHVNGWSIERFRGLWDEIAPVLERVRYFESIDLAHLDLIRAHPSCFRSKSDCFENFVVDNLRVLFRKR